MQSKFRFIVTAIAIFTLVMSSIAMAPAGKALHGTPASIYLKGGTFIPGKTSLNISAGLTIAGYNANQRGYYIVQFRGPVEESWKASLTAQGAELLDYIPDFAFKVRMNPGQAKKVEALSAVAYVDIFQPAFKISPDLRREGESLYIVRIETGADKGLATATIRSNGIQAEELDGNFLLVLADASQIEALANVLDVAWIGNFVINQTMSTSPAPAANDIGAGSIIGAATANARGYDGSTQIVAVADTGLGGGTASTAHRDIPSSRVVAIYNWPGATNTCFSSISNDGAIDVDSGHGTHTTGSVLSAGDPSGKGKGTAPAARLVFQATENYATVSFLCQVLNGLTNGYYLTGLPSDLTTLFQQAYTAGARIHSNSWGSAANGVYDANSVGADTFMWNNRDMLITFSAGNAGTDANSDGVIDNDSIGSPGTAKNVLTVGASENQRSDGYPCDTTLAYTTCVSQGGVNSIFTWGSAWPSSFPANPIKDDVSANNAGQMAAFSSRGPTDDGRVKPDVVAPGSWVLSTYSDLYQQGYDASPNPKNNAYQYDGYGFPYNAYYKYLSGTSMSNPITAGGAAVVRDYYQKAFSVSATSALVKGTLINTATDMADENNDGANDNDFPIPNNHEGWGRINLDAATDGSVQFVDEGTGLATNATQTFTITSTGGPLKVTVVWTDYPAAASASVTLVNDLDLTVAGPSGTFLGNVFSGGWSTTGGSADRRNNVENVYIQNAAAGTYTVTVKGYNVPSGPQKFALVVDGGSFGTGPTPTPVTPTFTPTTGPTATPTNTSIPPTPTNTPLPPTPTNTPAPVTSTGYLSASANAAVTSSSGDNNGYETNPANVYFDDGVFATDLNSGTGTSTSYTNNKKDRHTFYNYSFSIPTGATIKGIQVRVDARTESTASTPMIYVQLSWDGGTTWTTAKATTTLGITETTYVLGGTADTWGRTWTAANFANTSFRVRVIDVSSSTSRDFYLDYIAVNVTYQP